MAVKVKTRKGEPVARVLKRLRKMVEKEGLRRDMMRHRYFETERVRRRRQRWKNGARKARKAL